MRKVLFIFCSAILLVIAISGSPNAQDEGLDIGQREYENNCAVCHGTGGKGDGPLADVIQGDVPDLTTLQGSSQGAFPFARLYEVIDGRAEVRAHGPRDMPVWGDEYDAQAGTWLGPYYGPGDVENFVRGRILALIGYIQSLQAQ